MEPIERSTNDKKIAVWPKRGWSVYDIRMCVACYGVFLWQRHKHPAQAPAYQNRCPECIEKKRYLI